MQSGSATAAAFEAGQQACPGVALSPDRFALHARKLGVSDETLAERAADLFLACACAAGDPHALQQFDSNVLSQVGLYVARFSLSTHDLDEVRQQLRVTLLSGDTPGIAGYRGDGALAAWVRMTAVRMAIRVAGAMGSRRWADIDLLDLGLSVGDNPELATAKNLYRDRFNAALEMGLRGLDPRDKTLLRLSIVDGLNLDAIGAIYRVHRATVARWFVAIRARVLLSVRAGLGLRGVPSLSEMRSLVALLQDDIHLSAKRILSAEA